MVTLVAVVELRGSPDKKTEIANGQGGIHSYMIWRPFVEDKRYAVQTLLLVESTF